MRLLLPTMACTIAFVMKSATHANADADDEPSNPYDNSYSYRLVELNVDPEKGSVDTRQPHRVRPSSENYAGNSHRHRQSIIPRQTHSHLPVGDDDDDDDHDHHNHDDEHEEQEQDPEHIKKEERKRRKENHRHRDDDNHVGSGKVAVAKMKKVDEKRSRQRPVTRLNGGKIFGVEIPDDFQKEISQLRIPRRVSRKRKPKSSARKPRYETKPQEDADADTDADIDMDMNLDMDMDVNVAADMDIGNRENTQQDDNEDEGSNNRKKVRKRRKNRNKNKNKGRNVNKEDDDSGGGGGRGARREKENEEEDDENNHQEEEEEVEEKKEKVHKVTIKKKRPYVNETKPISLKASAAPAKHPNGGSGGGVGAPILHSHSHSYSHFPYQTIPGWNKIKAAVAPAKGPQKQLQNGVQPPGKMAQLKLKPKPQPKPQQKPLISQENGVAELLNPNRVNDGSSIRSKGVKTRDVNLILRTKNSPRILIRRYKPLVGAYPVGLMNQQKRQGGKRVSVYRRRPHKTRGKFCKNCEKKHLGGGKHRLYSDGKFPPSWPFDFETFQPINSNGMSTPAACGHTDHSQHYAGIAADTLSPLHVSTPGVAGSSFDLVDENLISPRLPSQPVNAYLRAPMATSSSSPGSSGRSSDDDGTYEMPPEAPLFDHGNGAVGVNAGSGGETPLAAKTNYEMASEDAPATRESSDEPDKGRQREGPNDERNTASTPARAVYRVHETDTEKEPDADPQEDADVDAEYGPKIGHKTVERLAAIHQLETDAGVDDQQKPHSHSHSLTRFFEEDDQNDAFAAPTAADQEKEDEQGEAEMEEEEEADEEVNGDRVQKQQQPEAEGEAEGEFEGDDEEQQDLEYMDDENANGSGNENENDEKSQSDKLFDISNSDTWADDTIET